MITRRTLLESLVGTAAAAAAEHVFSTGTGGLQTSGMLAAGPGDSVSSCWMRDESSGSFWPVECFQGWIDTHAAAPLLARAASGLATTTDPDRRLRLVLRRCHLQCIDINVPAAGACETTIRIQHWRQETGDLRTFFKSLGLARPKNRVQLVNRKRETVREMRGDEFLFGTPLRAGLDLDRLVDRWQRRDEPGPPDWTAAISDEWLPRWSQLAGPGIPWGALAAAWRLVSPIECPNCDTPAILAGFGHRRMSLLGFDPRREFVCPGCRRMHIAPLAGLVDDVAAML